MTGKQGISRRQFVTSAVSMAALSSLPAREILAETAFAETAWLANLAAPPNASDWKNQGIENLAKSPHAKLRNIPVRAVTVTGNFWAQRREINLTRSIP